MQPEQSSPRQHIELASLAQRLQAAILDKIIFPTIMLIPFIIGFDLVNVEAGMDGVLAVPFSTQLKVSLLEIILFMALNSYLLKEYGQTLGKRIVGIAVVGEDGNKLSLQDMITKRYLPFWVAAYIPMFGFLIIMANALAIFRGNKRRCLHDDLAKTIVIKLPKGMRIAEPQAGKATQVNESTDGKASDTMDA